MVSTKNSYWKKIFWSHWFLLAAFLAAAATAVAFGRAYYQDYQVRQDIARLQKQIQDLEAKKIKTDEILQYVKSDDFVEEKARLELNLAKPGEESAIIGAVAPIGGQSVESMLQLTNISNPVKWWRFFFHQPVE